ncbi:hypothetical protein FE840_011245 [Peteryoungia desertarenae]|uniref:HTH cro/C1-type domain-containing protein n=1 Tax=Peteryoungia desertarenae TaxID=1813451 RepID=A0ABX6QP33_9HYPH|nr:hypothetical protein [Peteryoungia desertarenae]QLF70066.1 hypothetical protein FE840_011245 [Peteryoungia desertarenae]
MTISAAQLRAARALLNLTVDELSKRSGLSAFTILQIEAENERPDISSDMGLLKTRYEVMGLRFLADGDGEDAGAGLRFAQRADHTPGIRPEKLNSTNDG